MLIADKVSYGYPSRPLVLRDVSLSVAPGERVALRAQSGAGKTTLCRILAGYLAPASGRVLVDGRETACGRGGAPAGALLHAGSPLPVQLIWQHPEQAFDPLLRVERSLSEAGDLASDEARSLAERLGVRDAWLARRPHELSGGELMRCCLLRALMARPAYLIADESTAMLDMVTQAEIWRALVEVADECDMGLLLVSHSEALVSRIATRCVELADL